jgi:hypothetical protein
LQVTWYPIAFQLKLWKMRLLTVICGSGPGNQHSQTVSDRWW